MSCRPAWPVTAHRLGNKPRQDQDGDEHFYGFLLHDHAGSTVAIGKRDHELLARARQVLAARPTRPAH